MGRQPNTTDVPERSGSVQGLEENLKKAVSEMLVLFLLNEREMNWNGAAMESFTSYSRIR